ncbi:MAG: carboxypeptidase regulatory-like domain-containing protein, partial [Pyrinomonadaceae bacterium]|nr:carboxypeptidase regulatory-like domain-containing protein [Pyrinomonadaceae bacterium]
MAEIPFAISASTDGQNSGGLAGVLSQLQGARVVVATANRTVAGSIITVEARHSQIDSTKPAVTSHRLVIASDSGQISGFDLAEVRSIQLADEGTRRDLSEFAHAAASARRRDAKTIVVTSDGIGQREMIVSYTIAAPIWKTTYRVVLDGTGKPFFQGWAIVDNVSEEDWAGIQLSLVSGTPVSFIQPIQNPVYRYRPVIPLSDELNVKPQTYETGVGNGSGMVGSLTGTITDPNGSDVPNATVVITNSATNQSFEVTTDSEGTYRADQLPAGNYNISATAQGFKQTTVNDLRVAAGLRSSFNLSLNVGGVTETVTVSASSGTSNNFISAGANYNNFSNLSRIALGVSRSSGETLSSLVAGSQSGVEAETTASEIGDLFEYRIDQPVTVARDRSALIPILQTRMGGIRVSIFRGCGGREGSVLCTRPMSGMLLKNTSPLTLENGSLTVVDGDAYAGEALLERLKPEEERLVSFALDLGTLVSVREVEERTPTYLVRAVNKVVQASYYNTRKNVYTLVNQTDRPRVVYLEHPKDEDDDWELTEDTAKPVVTTAKHYRFRVMLEPHQKVEFPVSEREDLYESYDLSKFTRTQLELFIARKYIDEPTRIALEKIIELKDRVTATDARLLEINKEATEIATDQLRLRENIKALTSTAEAKQLIARYVSKANDQETRLEQIEKDRRAIVEERTRLQSELDLAIRSLTLERKLR